jgi:Zn-dependent protease
VTRCPQCGTEIAPALLACPSCHRLVHADALQRLADQAERSTAGGDLQAAHNAWREARELLPPDSRQFAAVSAKITELQSRMESSGGSPPPPKPNWASKAGIPGAILFFIWKFKVVLAFVITKGKLLLLGLTKGSTFLSMLVSMGFYWSLWGWKFAVGFVISIYVHEMGHVAMLSRFGIPATAPMFIPGFGAVIRARFYPQEPVAEARVGLAGPIWGAGAAIACYLIHLVSTDPFWVALAHAGALINLFNLIPIWQLDGGHAFKALTRRQRWVIAAVLGGMYFLTAEGTLLVVAAVTVWRALEKGAPHQGDARTTWEYAWLVAVLGAMMRLPGAPRP